MTDMQSTREIYTYRPAIWEPPRSACVLCAAERLRILRGYSPVSPHLRV